MITKIEKGHSIYPFLNVDRGKKKKMKKKIIIVFICYFFCLFFSFETGTKRVLFFFIEKELVSSLTFFDSGAISTGFIGCVSSLYV